MKETASNGIGLGGIVFVVFLVLKLTKYIDWSWWWVTSPLWIPIAFAVTLAILWYLIMYFINLHK